MTTKTVLVTIEISVTVDETKFTPEFMAEFREVFYGFATLDEHIAHLGQMHARGVCQLDWPRGFIEGYGETVEMGIDGRELSVETEVLS